MTLMPANFSAPRRGTDTDFGDDGDARADVTIPVSASARKPEGTAGVKDLSRLSVGDDGRLYWDDKPVVVRRRVHLSPGQKFGLIVVGLAAFVIALSGAIHVTITAHDWMCRANWVTGSCSTAAPAPAPPARPELPN